MADPKDMSNGLLKETAHYVNFYGDVGDNLLTRLAARIRELQAEREWKPIETAPKDGTPILVLFDHIGVHLVAWEESVTGIDTWCVSDNKHGPYALRGYMNELAWCKRPTPPAVQVAEGSPEGALHTPPTKETPNG